MENRDFVIERILSIEDFGNVDGKFMETIMADDEYRRIFEEYKEISELASECVPEPKKDGITLHDAVMKRVNDGDIAPRYINTGFGKHRFPFATAACLMIILAVVVVAGITSRSRDNREVYMMNDAVSMESSSENSGFNMAPSDVKFAPKIDAAVLDSGYADEEAVVEDNAYVGMAMGASLSSEEAETEAAEEETGGFRKAERAEAETEEAPMYAAVVPSTEYCKEIDGDSAVESLDVVLESTVNANAGITSTSETTAEFKKAESFDKATVEVDIDAEVAYRLEIAGTYDISEEDIITSEDIEAYGKENFIVWFDSIDGKSDFKELYGKKQFIRFCAYNGQSE